MKTSTLTVMLVASAVLFVALLHNLTTRADPWPTADFADAPTLDVGGFVAFVAVGDFNGDGKPDLAVANQGAFDQNGTRTNVGISVLLGNGDGSFKAAVTYPTPYPQSVAVGDFNGDGKLDLAVAATNFGTSDQGGDTYSNGRVAVLLGKGDGTFLAAANYDTGQSPAFVDVGDFNGDGKPDLAVANLGMYDQGRNTYTNSSVMVLLGKGDGGFQDGASFATGPSPQKVVEGDFNKDGKPDLAVANYDGVSVMLGNGDGSFKAAFTHNDSAILPSSLAVGDFNGDGRLDLALAHSTNGLNVWISVLLGRANGTFQAPIDSAGEIGGWVAAVSVGDFNEDGKGDLAMVGDCGGVKVFFGNGDGTFRSATHYAGGGPNSACVAVGDFNGDGKPDLIAAPGLTKLHFSRVSVLLNNGNGSFQAAVNYSAAVVNCCSYPVSVAVEDFNGDGKPDLAVANVGVSNTMNANTNGTVSVLLCNGDGTFQPPVNYDTGNVPLSISVADFDGDGKPDLIVLADPYHGDSNNLSVLFGRGDGTFSPSVKSAGPPGPFVSIADFNGDGKPDLTASGDYSGTVAVLLGTGDGTFQVNDYDSVLDEPESVATGDFDNDRKMDLAVVGRDFTGTNSNISVLMGRGDGTFKRGARYSSGGTALSLAKGDFNADGKTDLVVANQNSFEPSTRTWTNSSLCMLLGNGDGTFEVSSKHILPFDGLITTVAVADFNGDGKLDLAISDREIGGTVWVLMGKGDGTFQDAIRYLPGWECYSLATGDFNGDGKPDLAAANDFGLLVLLNTSTSSAVELSIRRSGSAIILSWPSTSAGFALESTTIPSPTSWQPALKTAINNNRRFEITLPVDTRERYFRLSKR